MDKKEMINKLKDLESLLSQRSDSYNYFKRGCAEETLDKIERVKKDVAVLPGVPSVMSAMPVFPTGEEAYRSAQEDTKKSGTYNLIALAVTAILAVWGVVTIKTFVIFLAIVAGMIWYVVGKTHKENKQSLAKKETAYRESVAQSNASMERFRKALAKYPQEQKDGIAAAKEFRQFYCQKYEEHKAIIAEYEEKKDDALMQYSLLSVQIQEHDYIPEEYHHHVPKLITLLQSGRADNYKEALNIAIAEEREDAIEAARQEEEARRLEALELQAEEERRHNLMMERQEAAHQRAMERQAQEQAEAQRRAAVQAERDKRKAEQEAFRQKAEAESAARKQANATKMAGISKCASCANSKRCPSHVKNSGAGLTCGGYTPY